MSVGLGFIRQLLEDKPTFSYMEEFGLRKSDFTDKESTLLETVDSHLIRYGAFPSIAIVEAENDYTFPPLPSAPLKYWVDGLIKRTTSKLLVGAAKDIENKIVLGREDEAFRILHETYSEVSKRKYGKLVVSINDLAQDVLDEHDIRQRSATMAGIPFGFPFLDAVSGGAQKGDLVAIVAKTNVGKTYTLLKMANTAHENGYVPMVVSTEMLPIQYARRILAIRSNLPPERIRLGLLGTHIGRKKLQENIQELIESPTPYYIMKSSLSTKMEDVILQIREKRPDCIYVDGAYLLKIGGANNKQTRFEQVSGGVETLKLLAQEVGRPIIATYQIGNKKSSTGLDTVYQSDIIVQIASIVISLENDDTERGEFSPDIPIMGAKRSFKIMKLLKGREGERGTLRILFDMFKTEIREYEILDGVVEKID